MTLAEASVISPSSLGYRLGSHRIGNFDKASDIRLGHETAKSLFLNS